MATAMQDKVACVQSKESVAREMFWRLLHYPKTPGADEKLCVLAEVCAREVEAVVKATEPRQWCFGVAVTVSGKWAHEVLSSPHMTMANYPRTKRRLCGYVAEGWLWAPKREDEQLFASILRSWPAAEAKEAADTVRETIEFRMRPGSVDVEKLIRFGRFFTAPRLNGAEEDGEIARTIVKAIGRYANVDEVMLMGQVFEILQSRLRPALQDFVKECLSD